MQFHQKMRCIPSLPSNALVILPSPHAISRYRERVREVGDYTAEKAIIAACINGNIITPEDAPDIIITYDNLTCVCVKNCNQLIVKTVLTRGIPIILHD